MEQNRTRSRSRSRERAVQRPCEAAVLDNMNIAAGHCEPSGPVETFEQRLARRNEQREQVGSQLKFAEQPHGSTDFCSNDSLGMAHSRDLRRKIDELNDKKAREISARGGPILGSTGSRLLSGNHPFYEEVETKLAQFYRAPAAILFNSGFDLNLGFFGCVPQPDTIVVMDELIHASIRQGMLLSPAKNKKGEYFKHNDVDDLRSVLGRIKSEQDQQCSIMVVVESVYSMDGDVAPIKEICDVADEFGAPVVVDEAHGVGVFGKHGEGVVVAQNLQERVFCRIITFGKAPGVHGAAAVGSETLKQFLMNNAKPLIFSTSLDLHSLVSIYCSHEKMHREASRRQKHLDKLREIFKRRSATWPGGCALTSPSAVQGVFVPGNKEVTALSKRLMDQGFYVLPIPSPAVPPGLERIRIILHAHNTEQEVNKLMDALDAEIPRPTVAAASGGA